MPEPFRCDIPPDCLSDFLVRSRTRSNGLTSVSSMAKRQYRSLPSDVSRILLQFRQNGLLTDAINPTRPAAVNILDTPSQVRAGPHLELAERRDFMGQGPYDFVRRQHPTPVPDGLRIERHEFDVARLESTLAAIKRHRYNVRLHQPFHCHHI